MSTCTQAMNSAVSRRYSTARPPSVITSHRAACTSCLDGDDRGAEGDQADQQKGDLDTRRGEEAVAFGGLGGGPRRGGRGCCEAHDAPSCGSEGLEGSGMAVVVVVPVVVPVAGGSGRAACSAACASSSAASAASLSAVLRAAASSFGSSAPGRW